MTLKSICKDAVLLIYWHPFRSLVQHLHAGGMYRLSRLIAWIMLFISKRSRRLEKELSSFDAGKLSIPSQRERRSLIYNALVNYVSCELEVLAFPNLNGNNISSYVVCKGLENLDNALSQGRGAMLLFGHFGANQMVMPAIGYRGYKMHQLSAPATVWKEKLPERRFSHTEERMLEARWKHELSLPATHINIFGSLKGAFLALKKNEVLGVAIDGGKGKKRVIVDFLGLKALFSIGAMDIAMRTGCCVLPTFMVRCKDGRNSAIIEPPLNLVNGDADDVLRRNTELFTKRLEEYVLKYPDHYLNFLVLRSFMADRGDTPLIVNGDTAELDCYE